MLPTYGSRKLSDDIPAQMPERLCRNPECIRPPLQQARGALSYVGARGVSMMRVNAAATWIWT